MLTMELEDSYHRLQPVHFIHNSALRAFDRARNELVKAQKQRQNSEIGFESENFGEEGGSPPRPNPVPTNTRSAANTAQDGLRGTHVAKFFDPTGASGLHCR